MSSDAAAGFSRREALTLAAFLVPLALATAPRCVATVDAAWEQAASVAYGQPMGGDCRAGTGEVLAVMVAVDRFTGRHDDSPVCPDPAAAYLPRLAS